jgi:hypothetical protein
VPTNCVRNVQGKILSLLHLAAYCALHQNTLCLEGHKRRRERLSAKSPTVPRRALSISGPERCPLANSNVNDKGRLLQRSWIAVLRSCNFAVWRSFSVGDPCELQKWVGLEGAAHYRSPESIPILASLRPHHANKTHTGAASHSEANLTGLAVLSGKILKATPRGRY